MEEIVDLFIKEVETQGKEIFRLIKKDITKFG